MGCLKLTYREEESPLKVVHNNLTTSEKSCAGDYRYGFNGQEKDDEIAGQGNSYTAMYWQYDSRLGRRWNVDPIKVDWESPYATFRNNPVFLNDIDGDCPDCPDGTYDIEGGDTFWDLENEWGLDHGTLEDLNPGVDPTNLQVGQNIIANTDIPSSFEQTYTKTSSTTYETTYETQYQEQVIQRSYAPVLTFAAGASIADGPIPAGEIIGGLAITGFFLYDVFAPASTMTVPVSVPVTTPVTTTTETSNPFWYVTYTKTNATTGEVYVGRSSGYAATPQQVVTRRDYNHHMTGQGFGTATLSTSLPATLPGGYGTRIADPSYHAIRGSEQLQIEMYRKMGISGNDRNGISPRNDNIQKYLDAAKRLLRH